MAENQRYPAVNETQLWAIMESATDAIITIDAESTIRFANPAVEEVFGYTPDELVGKSLTTIMPKRFHDRHQEAVTRFIETGNRQIDWTEVELPGLRKDGQEVPLSISFSSFNNDGDQCFTGIIRDITERKERQRALEQQNERLDEFASIVSHDLQNPLNVAAGYLELAQEDFHSPELQKAEDALSRAESILDDTLTLAREGQVIDEMERVNLKYVATDCWQNVPTASATLEITADKEVQGDPDRLHQLFANLFRNAVEHGGGEVTVYVGCLDEGYYVEDDGSGIPNDQYEKIFEPGHSDSSGGTGFGLAIVQRIAEAHGWEIAVSEGREGGLRFEFTEVTTT